MGHPIECIDSEEEADDAMAKFTQKRSAKVNKISKAKDGTAVPATNLDPHLTNLFNSSVSRAQAVNTSSRIVKEDHVDIKVNATNPPQSPTSTSPEEAVSDTDSSSDLGESIASTESLASSGSIASGSDSDSPSTSEKLNAIREPRKQTRKRKREAFENDDLEEKYLNRLATGHTVRNVANREPSDPSTDRKITPASESTGSDSDNEPNVHDSDDGNYQIPQHESHSQTQSVDEAEKPSRTVFLGNVSTAAIKSKASRGILLNHLSSFFSDLPSDQKPKVVSLRFRSTAFADNSMPKKASFMKKELLDSTTQSTNAYAVYNSQAVAHEAVNRLNASIVLDRHLRVDSVAHQSKVDHRRCVFVGNLAFVNDDSNIKAVNEEEGRGTQQKKSKPTGDVEEGLWRQFKTAGAVESVRVVRDSKTRVGKGFAYVQFELKNPNSVEKALLFNDKKFPPLLPRKLRVTRAKSFNKTASNPAKNTKLSTRLMVRREPGAKPFSGDKSRAQLSENPNGLAVGAKAAYQMGNGESKKSRHSFKSPEAIVFEGRRAREGTKPAKLGKARKPRRTKRSMAYRSRMRKT